TDKIAELCDASHGGVCDVRRRLTEGGFQRVVERARQGAPRKVVGADEERLREMHADGTSVREIAKALGVSKSLVATEIKRLRLSPGVKQVALPMSAPETGDALVHHAVAPAGGALPVEEMSNGTSTEAPSLAPEASITVPLETDCA